jgi:hypothetical protein
VKRGLKADEKKDCRNSRNGIDARLGMEMYQSESICTAQGEPAVNILGHDIRVTQNVPHASGLAPSRSIWLE